jgi:hypothetical protein
MASGLGAVPPAVLLEHRRSLRGSAAVGAGRAHGQQVIQGAATAGALDLDRR